MAAGSLRWTREWKPLAPSLSAVLSACACVFLNQGAVTAVETSPRPIRSVAALRALPHPTAERGYEVEIVGSVVQRTQSHRDVWIFHDGKHGIWAENSGPPLPVGRLIRARGVSGPGYFAPEFHIRSFELLDGPGIDPPRRSVTYANLRAGALDCQYIEVEGIVARTYMAGAKKNLHGLELHTSAGPLHILDETNYPKPGSLVDARIRVRGFGFVQYDDQRQYLGMILKWYDPIALTILRPAQAREKVPITPLSKLMTFRTDEPPYHRVRVSGQVTAVTSDGRVGVQAGDLAIVARGPDANLSTGDQVEAWGFITPTRYGGELQYTKWQKLGKRTTIQPTPVAGSTEAALHGKLVTHTATVTAVGAGGLDITLDGFRLRCQLRIVPGTQTGWPILKLGSRVRVTGLCVAVFRNTPMPVRRVYNSIDIYPSTPADIVKLSDPPISTEAVWLRAGYVGLALISLVGAGSVVAARRAAYRERKRRELQTAVHKERQRIAFDLHDTLMQGLTVVSVRMEAARNQLPADVELARSHIAVASEHLRESLDSARQTIQQLDPESMEEMSLNQRIKMAAARLWPKREISYVVITTPSPLPPLPTALTNAVLLIVQESLTNVWKHAVNATKVDIVLTAHAQTLEVRIQDNGSTPEAAASEPTPDPVRTHHGLRSIKQRALSFGGTVKAGPLSPPAHGYLIAVSLPITPSPSS
jgi:signal transduction histidine kinase